MQNYMYKKKSDLSLTDQSRVVTRARDAPIFKANKPNCEAYKRSVLYSGANESNSEEVAVRFYYLYSLVCLTLPNLVRLFCMA